MKNETAGNTSREINFVYYQISLFCNGTCQQCRVRLNVVAIVTKLGILRNILVSFSFNVISNTVENVQRICNVDVSLAFTFTR